MDVGPLLIGITRPHAPDQGSVNVTVSLAITLCMASASSTSTLCGPGFRRFLDGAPPPAAVSRSMPRALADPQRRG